VPGQRSIYKRSLEESWNTTIERYHCTVHHSNPPAFANGHSLQRDSLTVNCLVLNKAVNREDKRSRRYRDRDFAKFERSRRYRDR
jgi:hypothetical protein